MTTVYVAAGSNVNPVENLRRALHELGKCYRLMCSQAYRNKAVGFKGEDFINLVVGFDTYNSVDTVISHLRQAEGVCGRARDVPKWAPRAMDLDLLLYGELVREDLRVPRADLLKRAYMLRPMAEIAPDLVHPIVNKSMSELWSEFNGRDHEMSVVSIT